MDLIVWNSKVRAFLFFLVLHALSCTLAVMSCHGEEEKAPCREITAPEVKHMLDTNHATVIHTLSDIEYEMQHITGSINIPVNKLKASDKLPIDKRTPLIFYCMGDK